MSKIAVYQSVFLKKIPQDYQFSNLDLENRQYIAKITKDDKIILIQNLETGKEVNYNTDLWKDIEYFTLDKSYVDFNSKTETTVVSKVLYEELSPYAKSLFESITTELDLTEEENKNLDLSYVVYKWRALVISPRINLVSFEKPIFNEIPNLIFNNN